jgi:hypothetical protein
MSRLTLFVLATGGLVGLIAITAADAWRGERLSDAISGVADVHLRCSAYYQTTADILVQDGDEDTADPYRERAAMALASGAELSGQKLLTMTQARNAMSATMKGSNGADVGILGDLASRYDDECVPLLNGQ